MKEILPEISYIAIDTRAKTLDRSLPVGDLPQMAVRSLGGVLLDPERYWNLQHSDRVPEECTVSEIIDSSGEWTALAEYSEENFRKFLLVADPSGFAPAFYALIPGEAVVISSTFSGVVQGIRRLGSTLTLNLENYLTVLTGKDSAFHNLIATETMANEIKILPYDLALFVDKDKVSLIERSTLSNAQKITSYKEALDQGIEAAAQSIQRLSIANPTATGAITLTGGADSRMVLAILLATGLSNNFGLWTIDPRERKSPYQKRVFTSDVEIANQLRKSYGMKWCEPFVREKLAISYEESLAFHQSFNSNFSYTFKPTHVLSYDIEPIISLRGGGGEILRGSGAAEIRSTRYNKYLANGGSCSDSRWLAKEYLQESFTSDETKGLAVDFLSRIFEAQHGPTIREKLDDYYRSTRNRGHFGHTRKSSALNDRLMQVLTNPYLLRAVELVNYTTKTSGGLVIDLLSKTAPELRTFPFENLKTDRQLRLPTEHKFSYSGRDDWQKAFDKRGKPSRSVGFRPLWEPGARGLPKNTLIAEEDFRFVRNGFEDIMDLVTSDFSGLVRNQHEIILQRYEEAVVPSGTISAKVASARDIMSPMPLDRPGQHYYTDMRSSKRIRFTDGLNQRGRAYVWASPRG